MRFDGLVAVVTGAGSGIGRAIVHRLTSEGARVVAVDIVADNVQAVVVEVQSSGGSATACVGDIAEESDVERMMQTALSTYGRLDILCNNAGIMDAMLPVAEASLEHWNRILSVNLTGAFLTCHRAVSIMLERGGGRIVNTASIAGLMGGRAGVAYTASKHGLIGLTRSIASNYGDQGIRCNAVCPGGVATAIGLGSGQPSQLVLDKVMRLSQAASSRTAQPEEIAAAIAFLASDDASYVNGVALVVDGGWTAA